MVGFITQVLVIRKILDHVGRRFKPLVLPGREMRKKKIPISEGARDNGNQTHVSLLGTPP